MESNKQISLQRPALITFNVTTYDIDSEKLEEEVERWDRRKDQGCQFPDSYWSNELLKNEGDESKCGNSVFRLEVTRKDELNSNWSRD